MKTNNMEENLEFHNFKNNYFLLENIQNIE